MFVDSVDIFVSSGNGGPGAISFRKEKFVIQGGPDGGDGGKGGDIIFQVDNNTDTLSNFRGKKHYKAQNGKPGLPKRCHGKNGENLIIKLPLGTQILDFDSGALLADLNQQDSTITLLKGGKGGLGNSHFKSATNQAPTYAQQGIKGQNLHIKLELKLIADVGLVGYPNVGKSKLISTLSNAKVEVADYEFTTLIPHLGVVGIGEYASFVMADIPGIIDGANENKGLGLEFLKHIERTRFLLFVLDCARSISPLEQFQNLRNEIKEFENKHKDCFINSTPLTQRPFGIMISKIDLVQNDKKILDSLNLLSTYFDKEFDENLFGFIVESTSEFSNSNKSNLDSKNLNSPAFILGVSSVSNINLDILKSQIYKNLQN